MEKRQTMEDIENIYKNIGYRTPAERKKKEENIIQDNSCISCMFRDDISRTCWEYLVPVRPFSTCIHHRGG